MKRYALIALLTSAVTMLVNAKPIDINTPNGVMTLTPMADNAIRVSLAGDKTHQLEQLIYTTTPDITADVTYDGNDVVIKLKDITAVYDSGLDALTFTDNAGNVILSEAPHSRKLTPSSVQGEPTYTVAQTFESPSNEYIFGTGQFQDGYVNIHDLSRRLTQVNTQISIPFILSNQGYGLLWNNYGLTDFNPGDHAARLLPTDELGEIITVDVTSDHGNKRETRQDNTFSTVIDIPANGDYSLLVDVGLRMARKHKVMIDDSVYVDINNLWLPPTTSFIASLQRGKHKVTVEGVNGDSPTVAWRMANGTTSWQSPVAQALDYTVIAGNADQVIGTYRHLTGDAPMMPIWALGYIHCRERFDNQKQLLDNAREFRDRQIPVDVIVQDWQWWGKNGWNAMVFDEDKYPDPRKMVESLHSDNQRLMLSVWSKIDATSQLGKEATAKGYYIPGSDWIDFFNPDAASFYWSNFSDKLLKPYGIDAWWQDATEPENDDLQGRKIAAGTMPGEVYRNVYPMFVTRTVYDGLRRDDPDRRVMILTRSGYSGMQRYAAATWSGDVGNDWGTLKRQIAGGLGQMAAGLPWWTYDAGGFFRPSDQYTNPEYHELFARWLQTATFLPLMRVHGYMSDTEPWRYGEMVDSISRKCIEMRYSLLPYTYSCAADVAMNGSTLMRPLVFDFPNDARALDQRTQFMFGKSLLVAPVTEPGIKSMSVYLPEGAKWIDYYTGEMYDGGNDIVADIQIDRIPVYVKAGSILPLAHDRMYATDKANEYIEIRIYPGADASFTLYNDDGVTYNYEKGQYSRIRFDWDDASKKLSISPRDGSYQGMLKRQTFNIVGPDGKVTKVNYKGADKVVNF